MDVTKDLYWSLYLKHHILSLNDLLGQVTQMHDLLWLEHKIRVLVQLAHLLRPQKLLQKQIADLVPLVVALHGPGYLLETHQHVGVLQQVLLLAFNCSVFHFILIIFNPALRLFRMLILTYQTCIWTPLRCCIITIRIL